MPSPAPSSPNPPPMPPPPGRLSWATNRCPGANHGVLRGISSEALEHRPNNNQDR